MTLNKLSSNLKNLLSNANISENELARKTGIAQQIINRILSGENKNPKIATLSPLATYFMVSISQLIGDETFEKTKLNTNHLGWHEIPILEWNMLKQKTLHELLSQNNKKLLVDTKASNSIFALEMYDSSMEPKFSDGTILIFDQNKTPSNGDFSLIKSSNNELEVRQLFIKKTKSYKKCLNPMYADYKPTLMTGKFNYLGVLIQSRTNHLTLSLQQEKT